MPLNVLEMLTGARRARAGDLEQLALRLFKGEEIPPGHVLRLVGECGATDEQLQREIDRLERVQRLREAVKAAQPARAKLATIEAELTKASDRLQEAATAAAAVRAKHADEQMALRHRIEAADRAMADLLDPANMCAADQAALEVANAEHLRTADLASQARQQLQRATSALSAARDQLQAAEDVAKHSFGASQAREAVDRAKAVLRTREAAVRDAEQAAEAAGKTHDTADKALQHLLARLHKAALR